MDLILETHDAFSASEPCLNLNSRLSRPLDLIWDTHHTWRVGGESPEFTWREFQDAGVTDETEINKITFENACRFFDWDPFKHTKREDASVGALRAKAKDVDTTRKPRAEWKAENEAAGIGVFTSA